MPASATDDRRHNGQRAFTLIELVFVLVLLSVAAAMVAPRMTGFFRGRALSQEAQRMLSLMHLGQSRAVSEGVPVILWINTKDSTYGLMLQPGYEDEDERASEFTVEPTLSLEVAADDATMVSETEDEMLGIEDGLAVVRFRPDGFFDDSSVSRIIIRQGSEAALQLAPTENRLAYEILPYDGD